MDIDPPFFQKETDSSNEDLQNFVPSQSPAYGYAQAPGLSYRQSFAKSSSADDYRSVIDDLTIENKRLREELRKFKQMGPGSMSRDKLFEVKVHGLSSTKKRELEAALRDFTTSLEGSSTGASTSRNKSRRNSKEQSSHASKHTASTSGSNPKPVDSAYASMGTGPSSSSHQLPGQARAARLRSNQNIEIYLRDIPEGLWPRPVVMTDKEKKKLVVRRLEHLFTGKLGKRVDHPLFNQPSEPIAEDIEMEGTDTKAPRAKEAAREAQIRSRELLEKSSLSRETTSGSHSQSHSNSRSNAGQSNFHDNDEESGTGSGHRSGSSIRNGKGASPQDNMRPSEQRPTRPRDLDPDRKQVPADNMEYIRHLGIDAPESQSSFSAKDVSPDAEGWVYLNLLCNLAQLHILNVTPDFIRTAVSEKSTKFQLSADGCQIRWRGGDEGTKFTSDSGSNSLRERSSDDSTDGSNEHDQRKRPKGSRFDLGQQNSDSSHSFHYKPLFLHHQTSSSDDQQSTGDDTTSSNGLPEESNLGRGLKWGHSGGSSAQSQRKRRRDGAIIYYNGAPFCTDLSRDCGEVSTDTYDMTSSGGLALQDPVQLHLVHRPCINRTASGSSIPFKPLSEPEACRAMMHLDSADQRDTISNEADDCMQADFSWSDREQQLSLTNLEASGLGGISPDDHFVVEVTTRRPKQATLNDDDHDNSSDEDNASPAERSRIGNLSSRGTGTSREAADSIANKLARMSTRSPMASHTSKRQAPTVEIDYVTGKVRRLAPVPLPPPAFYCPTDDSDFDDDDSSGDEDDSVSSERSILSKQPMIAGDPSSDNRDLSGDDEEDENSDSGQDFEFRWGISSRRSSRMSGIKHGDGPSLPPLSKVPTGSSAATAGGAASGYNSSMEDA
jgi:hypothetical protein